MPTGFSIHCLGCPYENAEHLSKSERQVRAVPLSMEVHSASVLLIFQAPGEEEWRTGKPISNTKSLSAGGRLARAFKVIGKARADYSITNTVQCFPGKREQPGVGRSRDKLPPALVRQHCGQWLLDDIRSRPFSRIVVFGSFARKAVKALGYGSDERFIFVKHPTGGLSNAELCRSIVYVETGPKE